MGGVLTAAAEQAAAMPSMGRVVPEFGREDVREVMRRGYRVVYLVTERRIEIVAVSEGHRLLSDDILDGSSPAEHRHGVAASRSRSRSIR